MALGRKISKLWESLFHRSRLDRELDEELREYLDGLIEKKIRSGQDPAAARRDALREMGELRQIKAEVQQVRAGAGIDALWQDVRYTCRSLIRKPVFAVVVIFTFALGIGTNTAIFSVVNSVLIQPLPYRDSSQLVLVWSDMTSAGYSRVPLSGPELKDLRDRGTLFSGFGAIWANTAAITGDLEPEQLRIGYVTSNFFTTLGADALIGRTFQEADEARGAPSTILLSWHVWQRRYGGDPSIVGRNLIVNGGPTTVIGVMPAEFRLIFPTDSSVPEDLEAWLPFGGSPTEGSRTTRFLRVIGRMKPGVTVSQARNEVWQIGDRVSREYTAYRTPRRLFTMAGLQNEGAREFRPGLLALLGAVAILLLTACLNVASLLIARAAARTKETAVRLAIGASFRQIIRQCLVEGLILAFIGGLIGLLVGELSLRVLVALRPAALTRVSSAHIDGTVLILTAGTALFWGVLFSFAPMIEIIRTDVIGNLLGSTRRIGAARYRTRAALVTLQVAFGIVLLVGAGLMIRTFISLQRLDPGYRSDQMLAFRVNVPGYPPVAALNEFHRRLQSQLAALPGVTGVGAVSHVPFDNIPNWGGPCYLTDGRDPTDAFADFRSVSPGYLETIGARLVAGRFFTEADDTRSQGVAIVDDLFARKAWPGESAIGKRISVNPQFSGRVWVTVVGVVRHMRIRSFVEELSAQVYYPIRQIPRTTTYVLRAEGDLGQLAGMIRPVVRRLDPQLPVYDLRPIEEYLSAARSAQRFTTLLAAAFAVVALVLAFVGVYGLVTYSVNTRRYEFGIRLALGAQTGHILRLVLQEGVALVITGMVVGIAGAAMVARFLQAQLFGVTAFDLRTYVAAIAVIVVAGLLASWFPARKASVCNPLEVIRTD